MSERIQTPLTRLFGIDHPVLLAPMDNVAGGRLAAAVSAAGGLGIIGGGYGDRDWLEAEFATAGNQPVGIGFITWSVARRPDLFDLALERRPKAAFFSFGDAEPFVERAKAAGVPTIWQVQRLAQARQALEAGVDVIAVQGQEAGGHGMDRGLFSLVPAVRDLAGPDQVIVAAGGIADGRGLAAALSLGADGVLMGTRFWASTEASGSERAKAIIAETGGDATIRTKVFDVARNTAWPWFYTGRVVKNAFAEAWHPRIDAFRADPAHGRHAYEAADPEDFSTRVVIAGEACDLIGSVESADAIVEATVAGAVAELRRTSALIA